MNDNFTYSLDWRKSIFLRYPIDQIVTFKHLDFFKDEDHLICQQFFNIKYTKEDLEQMKKHLLNGKQIIFKYMNQSNSLEKLKKWALLNHFHVQMKDQWDAPQLFLSNEIFEYINKSSHSQLKRNFGKYLKYKNDYIFKNSKDENLLSLWSDVLKIDYNSWKRKEQSDMKSLNREDLQYLPYMLNNTDTCNLVVIYYENEPLAYSLMFQDYDNTWYAVKWGASDNGRKHNAGFYCLYYHLELLKDLNTDLMIDFWGRRNQTYDELKNNSIRRCHLSISKKE